MPPDSRSWRPKLKVFHERQRSPMEERSTALSSYSRAAQRLIVPYSFNVDSMNAMTASLASADEFNADFSYLANAYDPGFDFGLLDIGLPQIEGAPAALPNVGQVPRWSTPTLEESGIAHLPYPKTPSIGSADAPVPIEASDAYDIPAVLANYRKACQRFDTAKSVFRDSFNYLRMSIPERLRRDLLILSCYSDRPQDVRFSLTLEVLFCQRIFYLIHLRRQSAPMKTDELFAPLTTWARSYSALRATCIADWNMDPNCALSGFSPTSIREDWTSDSCSTVDDEDERYDSVHRTLEAFRNDASMASTIIEPIHKQRMRKDVRAWARLAEYRCTKLSDNSMLLHKDKSQILKRRRRNRPNLLKPFPRDPHTPFPHGPHTPLPHDPDVWKAREPDKNAGYSSAESNGSAASAYSRNSGFPKPRLRSRASGYPCAKDGCAKVYNRACDLAHHQRSHRAKEEQPCECPQCVKRFPFPKDLRRHQKIHTRKSALDMTEPDSSQAEYENDHGMGHYGDA